MLDWGIVASEFELESSYYVPFRTNTLGKGMNSLILLPMGSTTTVLLEGWTWHQITQEGWYAIKQQNKLLNIGIVSEKENSEFEPVKLHLKIDVE